VAAEPSLSVSEGRSWTLRSRPPLWRVCGAQRHQSSLEKIYSDYITFLARANLWFRFTESTFDNYMQSPAHSGSRETPAESTPPVG